MGLATALTVSQLPKRNHPKSMVSSSLICKLCSVSYSLGPANNWSPTDVPEESTAKRTAVETSLSPCFLGKADALVFGISAAMKYLSCKAVHLREPLRSVSDS